MPSTRRRPSPKTTKIKKLLALGTHTPAMIADKVKCDLSHVYRIMKLQGINPREVRKLAASATPTITPTPTPTPTPPADTVDTVAIVPTPMPTPTKPAPFYGSIPPEPAHAASEIDDYQGGVSDRRKLVMNCIYVAAILAILATVLYLVD